MKFATKCPDCEKVLSVHSGRVKGKLTCTGCDRRFIPLEDIGLACPKCGEITMMTVRDTGPGVSCLGCGFVFKRRSIWRRGYYALPVTIGAGALVLFLYLLSASYAASRYRGANEASAISALRTISSAQELFNLRYGSYAVTLAALANVNMLDQVTARATIPQRPKSGYYFELSLTKTGWECTAVPAEPGKTGYRSFYIDESGVIYEAPCMNENDPPAAPGNSPLGRLRGFE